MNIYEYQSDSSLKILSFDTMKNSWLDFIVQCRRGIPHNYDTIWNYVDDFVDGLISKSAFWKLVKHKYPTHQIVFCSQQALKQLTFKRSFSL